MNEWHDLLVAIAGASAALTGLLFVGLSINLDTILTFPHLPHRAVIALILLSAILIISTVLLIPNQTLFAYGVEVLFVSLCAWLIILQKDILIFKKVDKKFTYRQLIRFLFDMLALLPYLVGSIILLYGSVDGIYLIVISFILGLIKSLTDAWVLLVEIKR